MLLRATLAVRLVCRYPMLAMPPDDESVQELMAQLATPGPPVLYHHPLNLGSQAVRLLLVEKDLAWQSRVLDTGQRAEHLMPWYLRLNRSGKLPTLVRSCRLKS